jgi:predicted transcriptional regulator
MVIECWRTERLTAEQAIGQILQFLQRQQKRQDELEAQLWELKRAHQSE